MDNQIDISIIIVSFNTKQLLMDCLDSVKKSMAKSTCTAEIIVVDNISTDGSREAIRKNHPDVILIENSENVGFGKANNQGISIAKGTYILLLNSDTVILGNAIEKLYNFCKQKGRAFVGPKLLNPDRSAQSSCSPFLTLPVIFAALFLKGDRIGLTRYSPNKPVRVDWVSGACIMAQKSLFLDGLLFDERIHLYMEEVDLLYRAKKKGYRTFFTPSAKIIHYGAASSKEKRKQPVLNIYRGLVFFYRLHGNVLQQFVLKILLYLKALIALSIGVLTGNKYLRETYAEALRLV